MVRSNATTDPTCPVLPIYLLSDTRNDYDIDAGGEDEAVIESSINPIKWGRVAVLTRFVILSRPVENRLGSGRRAQRDSKRYCSGLHVKVVGEHRPQLRSNRTRHSQMKGVE